MVTVKASYGTDMDTHEVTVTVTDVDEEGQADDLCLTGTIPTDNNRRYDRPEVIAAIREFLRGDTQDTRAQVIEIIRTVPPRIEIGSQRRW